MQTFVYIFIGSTPLSLTYTFEFLVSTKCKAIFAVASFLNASFQFFKSAWCSNLSESFDSLVNIYFYFSLFEAVLRECLTFLFFRRSCCSGRWLFPNYDLFVECAGKMDIWQFMKRSISDSRSVEIISEKDWELKFNQHRLMGEKEESALRTSICAASSATCKG